MSLSEMWVSFALHIIAGCPPSIILPRAQRAAPVPGQQVDAIDSPVGILIEKLRLVASECLVLIEPVIGGGDENELYAALDGLLVHQQAIETALARKHLSDGTLRMTRFSGSFLDAGFYWIG